MIKQDKTVYVVESISSPTDVVIGVFASGELARDFISSQGEDCEDGFFVSHHTLISE